MKSLGTAKKSRNSFSCYSCHKGSKVDAIVESPVFDPVKPLMQSGSDEVKSSSSSANSKLMDSTDQQGDWLNCVLGHSCFKGFDFCIAVKCFLSP